MSDKDKEKKIDEQLMLAFQSGDFAAFEQLYQRHKDKLIQYLCQKCFDRALAQDFAQTAWEKIIQMANDNRYKPKQNSQFKTLLYTIAYRKYLDFVGSASERTRLDTLNFMSFENSSGELPGYDPEATEQERQKWNLFGQALAKLPHDQRDVLLLRLKGFSFEEMSDMTGILLETVRSKHRYAVKKIKMYLQESGFKGFNDTDED